jgi:hypothetical protein
VLKALGDYDWKASAMREWHEGRCAICGGAATVTDHDHKTALVRGKLCGSCNTLEGARHGGVFTKYRERNPAAIWGVREVYVNPRTGNEAQPEIAASRDKWQENPMKGLGL